ncbi:MAG: InlB B-repeat-containing protein [Actinomycetia bacterium]|nr:InlB B-repeat-containing protein [Actinomycetes bacterium]
MAKRALSILLAFTLVLSAFPVAVFAGPEDDYASLVGQITALGLLAEGLRDTDVPDDAKYSQEEYDQAIENYIAGAARDLEIANALLVGNGALAEANAKGYATDWMKPNSSFPNPDVLYDSTYRSGLINYGGWGDTPTKKQANALAFLQEGGYEAGFSVPLLGGAKIKFVSSFHPGYSSGLFGILANKADVVTVMSGTLDDLCEGKPYNPLERAIARYTKARSQLIEVKANPEALIDALLEDDANLSQLVSDLNILIGSLDDIVNIIDLIGTIGLSNETMNSFLGPLGLNFETLEQLKSLRDTLNFIGIDTSGNLSVEESLAPLVGTIVGAAVDLAVGTADLGVLAGTPLAYNTAADGLESTYQGLMNNALAQINVVLGPILNIMEPIRPYIQILGSGVRLVNDALLLVDKIGTLSSDFSLGNLSGVGYVLSDTLFDFADLIDAFIATGLSNLLPDLMGNTDVGGAITGGLAGLLNSWLSGTLGSGVQIDPGSLSTIGNTINALGGQLLGNPTGLSSLLRASGAIVRNLSGFGMGLDNLFKGNFADAFTILIAEFQTVIPNVIDTWNALMGLFSSPSNVPAEVAEVADVMPAAFQVALFEEAQQTAAVLSNPNISNSAKQARLHEYRCFVSDIRDCISDMRETIKQLENARYWARTHLSENDCDEFVNILACHYALELMSCMKGGVSCARLPQIRSRIKAINCELVDVIRIIKSEGSVIIFADPIEGLEDEHFTLSTNYDELIARLAPVFECLGISTGYEILYDSSDGLFHLDGSTLKSYGNIDVDDAAIEALSAEGETFEGISALSAGEELIEGYDEVLFGGSPRDHYHVKVGFVLKVNHRQHDHARILATKWLKPGFPCEQEELFTVSFEVNGGEPQPLTITVVSGAVINLPMASKLDYDFEGWFDGEDYVGTSDGLYTVTKDVTLVAQWRLSSIDNKEPIGGDDIDIIGKKKTDPLVFNDVPTGDSLSVIYPILAVMACAALCLAISERSRKRMLS